MVESRIMTDKLIGASIALALVVALSIAIWKWAKRYKTGLATWAALIMIVGLLLGIGVPGGLIIFVVGLIMMLVARQQSIRQGKRQGMKRCQHCGEYVQAEDLICSQCGGKFPAKVSGIVVEE